MRIVIVGHGPGAISLASKNREIWKEQEAHISLLELTEGRIDHNTTVKWPDGNLTSLKGCKITSNPEEVIPDATIVLFCNPLNTYPQALKKISRYATDSLKLICGVPGATGFDWMVREAFLGLNPKFTVGAVETLPFIAKRENEREIKIFAVKQQLYFASSPLVETPDIDLFSKIIGAKLKIFNHFLSLTLLSPGAKVNPVLFLEALNHLNSTKVRNIYELGDENEKILQSIEDEVQAIGREISFRSGIKLDDIPTLKDWFIGCYPELIEDKSTTRTCLTSHSVYSVLQENFAKGLNEDFDQPKSRYLTEQIPYGLVSLKGLAELAETPTPTMDAVIEKCQQYLESKFIENGSLIKSALKYTSAPQRFGIDVLSKLTRIYIPHTEDKKLETAEFKRNGVTFFGKLLSESSCNEVNEKITEKLRACPESDVDKSLLNLHWKESWFAELVSRPEFVNAACSLLEDDDVKIFSSLIVVKPPLGKSIVPWHQDAAYQWPIDPIDCASLWLALDDVSVENGAMEIALGGHLSGALPMRPTPQLSDDEYFFSSQLQNSIEEKNIKDFSVISCTMLRGECSFHHSMLPHSSPPNLTSGRRCAFVVRYCKGDTKLKLYPGMPREEFFKNYRLFDPKENRSL